MSVIRIRNKDETASIAVLDSRLRKKLQAVGHAELTLPDGIYKVEVRLGASVEAKVVILEHDCDLSFDVRTFSPAPIDATAQADKELMRFASERSHEAGANGSGTSSIFIFVRNARLPVAGNVNLKSFEASTDTAYYNLLSQSIPGAFAFGTRLEPGAYCLGVSTPEGDLCQAIYAVSGRQTQVFLPDTKRESSTPLGPDMAGTSIFCGSEHGFDPFGRHLRFLEHAKGALQNGIQNTPAEVRDGILWAALDDPIIGIMAGYLLAGSTETRAQAGGILERLRKQLGDQVPDVEALALLIGLETQYRFRHPPMLRAGWEATLRASARAPWIVPGDSKLNELAGRIVPGSVWLLWLEPRQDVALGTYTQNGLRVWLLGVDAAKDKAVEALVDVLRSGADYEAPTGISPLLSKLLRALHRWPVRQIPKWRRVKPSESVVPKHIEIDRNTCERAILASGLPAAELERNLEKHEISIKWR